MTDERNPLDVAHGVLEQYDDPEADKRIPSRVLARAVIAQDAELTKLRAALAAQTETATRIEDERHTAVVAVIAAETERDTLKVYLREALHEWEAWRNDSGKCPPGSDGRIVELRKLVTP